MAKKEMTFEIALKELEKTVAALESGNLDLEKSLETYKRGVELAKFCKDKLVTVHQVVEQIMDDGHTQVFDEDEK